MNRNEPVNRDELTVTVDMVMAMRPCPDYTRARVEELARRRERLTFADVLRLRIPSEHRIWLMLHVELMPLALIVQAANDFADRAVRRVRETSTDVAWNRWADGWLSGRDRTSNAAVCAAKSTEDAAWAAEAGARAAARAAALAAAEEAALAAARAAWDAARDAALAAARAARDAGDASGAAETRWQLKHISTLIRNSKSVAN